MTKSQFLTQSPVIFFTNLSRSLSSGIVQKTEETYFYEATVTSAMTVFSVLPAYSHIGCDVW